MTEYCIGRRLSLDGALCTVRYHGLVDGTEGSWLGVEWDDPQCRGKHDGSHRGRRYFRCLSDSPTAASFIRPSRRIDEPLSFLDALRKKYVSNEGFEMHLSEDQIQISGKTVEEVGFEKIRQQLAALQELRIVILDGLRIAGISNHPGHEPFAEWEKIKSQGLSIHELDVSRNLLEEWYDVVGICSALRYESLRNLKLDGNRFRNLDQPNVSEWKNPFPKVAELSLRATYFSWSDVMKLLPQFSSLHILDLSSNGLNHLSVPLPAPHLTTLYLSSNKITSLSDISSLTNLPNLEKLILRNNQISSIADPSPTAEGRPFEFPVLKHLDLASTLLSTLSSLDPIPTIFPALTSLLTMHAPLTTFPSSTLLTIARIPTLTELNYSPITTAERQNAELYYLSTIAKQLSAAASPAEGSQIINQHPRWAELCKLHGEPAPVKKPTEGYGAATLGARVTEFTFYVSGTDLEIGRKQSGYYQVNANDDAESLDLEQNSDFVQKSKLIPRTVDIYRLKSIVGRLFGIQPMSCRLIWETGEWDPVGGQEDEGWSVSEDESESGDMDPSNGVEVSGVSREKDKTKWEQREMELVGGTREVGFWVEGRKARVRVEVS